MQPFFERCLEEAHREGEQIGLTKGLQEGQRRTHIKNIKQVLAIRFEVERDIYDESLEQLALSDLEELLPVALKVQEIAEFETALAGLIPADDASSDADEVGDDQS